MPRARNIKPSFFSNDQLAENDPLGRLLFIGMWTLADYKGELEWREKRIKAQLFPYDDCDIKKLAINLEKSGFIRFYSDGEKIYAHVVNFSKHQNPHKNEREKGSDIPGFKEEMAQVIDLKGITINRDKSGEKPESYDSDPADSFILNPESCSPIPDGHNHAEPDYDELFESFWDSGMKKVGKKDAKTKFLSILKKQADKQSFTEKLINDVRQRLIIGQLGFTELHPTTYLNGERWNDELRQQQPARPEQPRTAYERSRAALSEQEAAVRRRMGQSGADDHQALGEDGPDVRLQVHQPVRGGGERDLDQVLEGDFWPADSGRS